MNLSENNKNESVGFCFSSEFWTHLAEQQLSQRPYVLKHACAEPPLSLEEVFRTIVKVSERSRAGRNNPSVRFYLEHSILQVDVGTHLPHARDGSFEGYMKRISRKLKGQKFGLIIFRFQELNGQLYLNLRDFMRELYERTDTTAYGTYATLFLGDYERSPIGLHYDAEVSTITFVLAGRKRLLVWPPGFFAEGRYNTLDYERYRNEALILEGEPGDVIVCPANYWHVADSEGGLALTLVLGYLSSPEKATVRDDLSQVLSLVEECLREADSLNPRPFDSGDLQESAGHLSQVSAKARQALTSLSNDPEFEEAFQVARLNQLSSFFFNAVPPPLPRRALTDDELVGGNPHYPVLWVAGVDGELICSANGHGFSVAGHPNVLKLLERMNSGETCRVGELIEKYAGTVRAGQVEFKATPKDIRAILEKLYSLRAILTCG